MKLEINQAAAITGAASGIGFALAQALGARGLRLALLDIEAPALAEAMQTLRDTGVEAEAYPCDISDANAVVNIANQVQKRFGGIDLLINNAGVGGMLGPMWHTQPQDWQWAFGVNVFGVVNGVRAFLPGMLQKSKGHIVNIASLAGLTAPPFLSPYVATKHAVVGLSESLAVELSYLSPGIHVSVVCPGSVASRILQSERNRPDDLQATPQTPPELLARIRSAFEGILANPMPADELASIVLGGVERDEALILTHPASNGDVLARLAPIERKARGVEAAP